MSTKTKEELNLTILNGRIDRAINELIDIDVTLAQATGEIAIGFSKLYNMKRELGNNARKAVEAA